ncbi:MAG TPA: HD domain-containing protein [Flavipsychrobacter sp.]|nr:HD domain-containing protein [Flavipsychrobacter sp.]
MNIKGKIINDPVYGFLKFPETEIMKIIEHPWFQRLRGIRQMGLAYLVYPGAMHTRFHHSLGACHLMGKALDELKTKDIDVSKDEYTAARIASLLHDIGHGPFSHALEYLLIDGLSHEKVSHIIMKRLNTEFDGMLEKAIQIFDYSHSRGYLHQLVSSQLDVDRMDYLNRDSFYTGVSEGVIGYDRILQMLTVRNNELMVEEKGVQSIEKFIIARRLMYWQVYLHKTVLGAEHLLINIIKRAKELAGKGVNLFATPALTYFLYENIGESDFESNPEHLIRFCELDDYDVLASIKVWQSHDDKILSLLCKMMILRKLYKVILSSQSLASILGEKRDKAKSLLSINEEDLHYFVFTGTTSNSSYNINDERINIAMKDGSVKNISEIDDSLVNQALARPVHKNYICYIQS